MPAAALPPNETQRIERLRALKLLDTPPEALFDGFVRTAAAICEVPIAAISLVDSQRQWFKAQVGLGATTQTPRAHAFCAHTILGDSLLEVTDALADPRFVDNPLVHGQPNIRFYAGAPLSLDGSLVVGTLCAIGSEPKRLTAAQASALQALAQTLSQALLLRDPGQWSAAEDALMHSERKYRQLAESSPFGIYYSDADGTRLYSNDRFRELLGVSSHEQLGALWNEAVHPEDALGVRAAWLAASAAGRDYNCRFRARRLDGQWRVVSTQARPTLDEQGRVTGWVGVAIDETDQQLAEERLREEFLERERLRRHAHELRDLLNERSAMIDVLAHEVRQPLNSAAAALDAVVKELHQRGDGGALRDARQASRVLSEVIEGVNNTLAVSTALMTGDSVPVDVDLDMLLSVCVGDLQPAERSRVVIERQTALRTLCVDMGLMRMALRNLLVNALRYSAPGTPVRVTAGDALPPAVLNIDVADTGPGIEPALLAHVFERGRRGSGRSSPQGHGLGLYIARRALELQQGRVEVLRSGEAGTVMRIQLLEA